MRAQILGHVSKRMKDSGKEMRVGLDERIVRVADVKLHLARIGADGQLDGVANVVFPVRGGF